MRRFLLLAIVCGYMLIAGFARAQQLDLAVGGNTLWSPQNKTASVGFLPPPEKNGMYPSFSAEYIRDNHFGFNVEGAFRYRYGLYDNFQPYRPILYDVNGVYTATLARKTRGDFMAGIGAQTVLFYNQIYSCGIPTGGCRNTLNNTHFLVHFGAGIRYSLWRGVFVRPEAHWYFIPNNFEFHSDNVFRVGVSLGYTFGARDASAKVRPGQPAPPAEPAPPTQPAPTTPPSTPQ